MITKYELHQKFKLYGLKKKCWLRKHQTDSSKNTLSHKNFKFHETKDALETYNQQENSNQFNPHERGERSKFYPCSRNRTE
jgi:hypothetical protein